MIFSVSFKPDSRFVVFGVSKHYASLRMNHLQRSWTPPSDAGFFHVTPIVSAPSPQENIAGVYITSIFLIFILPYSNFCLASLPLISAIIIKYVLCWVAAEPAQRIHDDDEYTEPNKQPRNYDVTTYALITRKQITQHIMSVGLQEHLFSP